MVHDQSKRMWEMMKTASAKSGRDSRREAGHASTSEWCRWRRPSQGGTLGGRPDTHLHRGQRVEITRAPRFGDLAWKITKEDGFPVWASKLEWGAQCGWAAQEGFSVWASKPRMALDAVEWPGGFDGLGLKTITGEGFLVLTQNRG